MFFRFPDDAHWDDGRLGIGIGDYEGVARIPRRVFQRLVDGAVTPERCVEAFHLQRTRFERIVERKLRTGSSPPTATSTSMVATCVLAPTGTADAGRTRWCRCTPRG